ncbi:MAG TPA: hypothetical protein PK798_03010 [Flavobacteriales bacterium]|nr:hypothetical protein [Flavobacteriales bacterium]HRJ37730.1 hypothetical protein [Flavobacteriales bacterium]
MTNATTILQSLTSRLCGLRDNTKVIENSDLLDFSNIEEGVLTVYATWSGQAVINCTQTIRTLYEQNYKGQIIVIDTDCMTPDFQIEMFGQVCHGWGEIFIINNGKISNKYLGKDSFANYKVDSNRQKEI